MNLVKHFVINDSKEILNVMELNESYIEYAYRNGYKFVYDFNSYYLVFRVDNFLELERVEITFIKKE